MTSKTKFDLQAWMDSEEYLPDVLRDFHDQKDVFKNIHMLYKRKDEPNHVLHRVNWQDGHMYTIDCFLWYMAQRGFTLQRSKKKVTFRPWGEDTDKRKDAEAAILNAHLAELNQ